MAIKFLNTVAVDTDVLYVDASSNRVGIGTTSPAKKLDVNGSTNIDGTLFVNATNNHIRLVDSDGTGNFSVGVNNNFQIRDVTANTTPLTIKAGTPSNTIVTTSSGNVGIGTTSPTKKLDIVSTNSGSQIQITSPVPGIKLIDSNLTTRYAEIKAENGNVNIDIDPGQAESISYFSVDIDNSEKFRINKDGNVGIGTTSPTRPLSVYRSTAGSVANFLHYTDSTAFTGLYIDVDNANNIVELNASGDTAAAMAFQTGNNERMRIDSNGNVGIGRTNPGAKLHVDGSWILDGISGGHFENYTYGSQLDISELSSGGWARANRIVTSDSDAYVFSGVLGNDTTLTRAYWTIGSSSDAIGYTYSNGIILLKNGNVGIGTTIPSEKLEVAGNARITGDVTLSNGNALRWTSDDVRIEGTTAGDNIKFYVANTEILQLAQSGTLATVTGNLRVTGAYYDSNNLPGTSGQVLSSTATGTDWVSLSEISGVDGTGTTNYVAKWSDTDTITDSVIYDNGTNVGIGTNTPNFLLDVEAQGADMRIFNLTSDANTDIFIRTTGTAGSSKILFGDSADPDVGNIIYRHNGDSLAFTTNNSEAIRITGAGNVGIGDTGPAVKLQVSTNSPTNNVAALIGDGWVGNSSYHKEGGLLLISGTSQNTTQTGAGIAFQTRNTANTNYWKSSMIMDRDGAIRFTLGGAGTVAGSEDFTILSSGNVGIGTTSPSQKLTVAGNITQTSNAYYIATRKIVGRDANGLTLTDDSGANGISIKDGGLVQLINYGSGTNTGTVTQRLGVDSSGIIREIPIGSGAVDGSGTANYLARWTDTDTISIGSVYDNGTGIGIGTTTIYSNSVNLNNAGSLRIGNAEFISKDVNDMSLYQNKMRITSAGNVGIGTTSPSQKLHVYGKIKLEEANGGTVLSGNYGYFKVSPTNNYGVLVENSLDAAKYFSFGVPGDYGQIRYKENTSSAISVSATGVGIGTTSPSDNLEIGTNGDVDTAFRMYSDQSGKYFRINSGGNFTQLRTTNGQNLFLDSGGTAGYITFAAGDSERMRINYDGYVGIATTNPQSQLQINGGDGLTVTANDAAYVANYFGRMQSDYGTNALRLVSRAGDVFRATNYGQDVAILTGTSGAGTSERMRITSAGNVGIGTTSPSYPLHVESPETFIAHFKTTDNVNQVVGLEAPSGKNTNLYFYEGYTAKAGIRWDGVSDSFIFKVNNTLTDAITIKNNGNVGIGTTSPQSLLHIYKSNSGGIGGELRLDNNGSAVANKTRILFSDGFDRGAIVCETENSPYSGQLQFQTGYSGLSTKMLIKGNGNVGIGTTSPQSKLQVAGGVQMADDTDAASADKVGTLRYRTSGNNSYVDMCMQTGATTYEWVNIVQNNW